MYIIKQEFVDDLKAIIAKHKLNELFIGESLGQAFAKVTSYPNVRSVTAGVAFTKMIEGNAVAIIKDVVETLLPIQGDKRYVFNDLDSEFRVWKTQKEWTASWHKEEKDRTVYKDDVWALYHDDHGHSRIYIIRECCGSTQLHIREFPYNISEEALSEALKLFIDSYFVPEYRNGNPMTAYGDERDKGFILSVSFDKSDKMIGDMEPTFDCHADIGAIRDIETVVEHFVCILEDIKKGEPPQI